MDLFLGPYRKRHLDRFILFVGLTVVTNKHTDRHRYMCNNSPQLMRCTAMQPKSKKNTTIYIAGQTPTHRLQNVSKTDPVIFLHRPLNVDVKVARATRVVHSSLSHT